MAATPSRATIPRAPRRLREPLPTHIDTTLVPLRPGIVLTNSDRPCLDSTLEPFHGERLALVPCAALGAQRAVAFT